MNYEKGTAKNIHKKKKRERLKEKGMGEMFDVRYRQQQICCFQNIGQAHEWQLLNT